MDHSDQAHQGLVTCAWFGDPALGLCGICAHNGFEVPQDYQCFNAVVVPHSPSTLEKRPAMCMRCVAYAYVVFGDSNSMGLSDRVTCTVAKLQADKKVSALEGITAPSPPLFRRVAQQDWPDHELEHKHVIKAIVEPRTLQTRRLFTVALQLVYHHPSYRRDHDLTTKRFRFVVTAYDTKVTPVSVLPRHLASLC